MEPSKERIYIGGLNPPRLSARDIFRRLKSINQIEIESASIVDKGVNGDSSDEDEGTRPYLHITASSKHDSDSALSIISKQYHNVKWKGCKLIVEKAKPHFLDRLEEERRQRRERTTGERANEIRDSIEVKEQPEESEGIPSRIPRRLRVRKKFGDTALHVDTKPWTVESWSRFHKARGKLQKQEEKHKINVIAYNSASKDEHISQPGPMMHRAVHIRFSGGETGLNGGIGSNKKDNNESRMVISSSASSSDSSTSDSDSDTEASNESINKKEQSERYTWSEEDSDSSHSEEEMEQNPDDGSQSTTEILLNQKRKASSNDQKDDGKYQWSTEEESSDDEEDGTNRWSSTSPRNNEPLRAVHGTDEFAAGFEDTSSFDRYENDDNFEGYDHGKSGNLESDLTGDVTSNLNILSSIFPDMVDAKPINPNNGDVTKSTMGSTESSNVPQSKNTTAYGIMPRFDPTAKSSKQFEVEEEPEEEEPNSGDEESASETRSSIEDADLSDNKENSNHTGDIRENDSGAEVSPAPDIYEQEKLENVFRDARDAWGTEDTGAAAPRDTSATDEDPDKSSGKSSFSFGFNLDDNDASKKQKSKSATEAFSFSFSIPEQDQATEHDKPNTIQKEDDEHMETATQCDEERDSKNVNDKVDMITTDENVATRLKGLTLPEGDLKTYVDNFFALNDGARIMKDPEGFRRDEKEKTEWNRERQTLTLDWKRKRKYAVTRIQKRMKTRR
ncbi:unnamed protein product [Pseudo-nitzschia multistriata]|uniref:RRM domain-containing protein n=1 Tax=Pseudo-nitzschia multistriata TaxID=183589 RepID=A0A448ZD14_9STRA|nr:unnamed protein product [Pseudo-nitzschia multistriata]